MHDNSEEMPKDQDKLPELPLKTMSWTALKRAAEDNGSEAEGTGGVQLKILTTELPDARFSSGEIAFAHQESETQFDKSRESVSSKFPVLHEVLALDDAPVKLLNWAALKFSPDSYATEESSAEESSAATETGVETGFHGLNVTGGVEHDSATVEGSIPPAKSVSFAEDFVEKPISDAAPESHVLRNNIQQISTEIRELRREIKDISHNQARVEAHGLAQGKVFDVLHSELQDYKNDFVNERFKPTIRALLYLCDALEQFDQEIQLKEEECQRLVPAQLVRENISFFRGQLVEALATCAVTPMETPKGTVDLHRHKVVKVVPVSVTDNNTVQKVLRGGWFLNENLLRPADVVMGKADRA
jgi:molecular chaperone GrpE (heat shock protein)